MRWTWTWKRNLHYMWYNDNLTWKDVNCNYVCSVWQLMKCNFIVFGLSVELWMYYVVKNNNLLSIEIILLIYRLSVFVISVLKWHFLHHWILIFNRIFLWTFWITLLIWLENLFSLLKTFSFPHDLLSFFHWKDFIQDISIYITVKRNILYFQVSHAKMLFPKERRSGRAQIVSQNIDFPKIEIVEHTGFKH